MIILKKNQKPKKQKTNLNPVPSMFPGLEGLWIYKKTQQF